MAFPSRRPVRRARSGLRGRAPSAVTATLGALVLAVTTTAAQGSSAAPAVPDVSSGPSGPSGQWGPSAAYAVPTAPDGERAPGTGTDQRPRHASDGAPAWRATEPAPPGRLTPRRSEVGWEMAPGISYRTWVSDSPRGRRVPSTVRIHVVSVDLADPSTELDLISTAKVAQGTTVGWMAQRAGAVAAVNGDFFDIGDTGAPLGVGKSRSDGLRHAPEAGWNSTFWVDKQGAPHVGELPYAGRAITPRGNFRLSGINAPTVARDGIGLYTQAWGRTRGRSVTEQKRVRQVVIRKGVVVRNRFGPTTGKQIPGRMLVGQGRAAGRLKALRRGDRVRFNWRLKGARPAVAISGDRPLLQDGTRVVVNDVLMHPRTAVGIDEDGARLHLVAVDGRSQESRGYTMVELADLMASLGAENALNLDGGGSSTLVGPTAEGVSAVLNAPSDGRQRKVPNGLGVFSRPES